MNAKISRYASLPRRKVMAAGLAALAMGAAPVRHADARIMLSRGMTGGGMVRLDGDEPELANFSIFASAIQFPEGGSLVLGTVRWIESGSGLRLQSTEVTVCRPMRDRPDGAEIRGRMNVNGEGGFPFLIHAIDAGAPGAGLDAIRLDVNGPEARADSTEGEDLNFRYEASASLVAGDLQWVIVDTELPD